MSAVLSSILDSVILLVELRVSSTKTSPSSYYDAPSELLAALIAVKSTSEPMSPKFASSNLVTLVLNLTVGSLPSVAVARFYYVLSFSEKFALALSLRLKL